MTQTTELTCTCGKVRIEAMRAPIVSAECHCDSCRAAAARLQDLPGTPSFIEPNGGIRYAMYRKDRVRFVQGANLLREFRLSPDAKTRRVVASCCNTPVFTEFQNGHWLSLFGCLWPAGRLPAPEVRTMTSDLADTSELSDDVPNAGHHTPSFLLKILMAWVAMGFRTPKIDIKGVIDA